MEHLPADDSACLARGVNWVVSNSSSRSLNVDVSGSDNENALVGCVPLDRHRMPNHFREAGEEAGTNCMVVEIGAKLASVKPKLGSE